MIRRAGIFEEKCRVQFQRFYYFMCLFVIENYVPLPHL